MSYSGRVYDGPWEGRSYASPNPWFNVAITQPLSALQFDPKAEAFPIAVDNGEYRWSHPLRAWVYVWRPLRTYNRLTA